MAETKAVEVERGKVLAYRIMAQQLDRSVKRLDELSVLDLGVQDTPYGSARMALAARAEQPLDERESALSEREFALVWAARGAPHLHRWAELPRLAAALWPLGDDDAAARISNPRMRNAGALGLSAFTETARAFREVVTERLPKGLVSAGVSARVPPEVTYDCGACDARHISGALFQQAGLAGGVRLETGGRNTELLPLDDPPQIPEEAAGTEELVRAYLRLNGPATPADAAAFLGIAPTGISRVWPDDLVEVRIGPRRAWLPLDRLDHLMSASVPRMVRLLPPSDPFLQARDRDLLVPDRTRKKAIWRILGSPGALLVDGEIVGTWRTRKLDRAAVEITIVPFEPLSGDTRVAAEAEAHRVAVVRGAAEAITGFGDGPD